MEMQENTGPGTCLRKQNWVSQLIRNEGAQTYLKQYCTDTTLDIDQRPHILCQARKISLQVDGVLSTEMHLTQAQLFYCNGDKQQAYYHLQELLTWMLDWPNASSIVTLASNGSDTDRFLTVAQAVGLHHIMA